MKLSWMVAQYFGEREQNDHYMYHDCGGTMFEVGQRVRVDDERSTLYNWAGRVVSRDMALNINFITLDGLDGIYGYMSHQLVVDT